MLKLYLSMAAIALILILITVNIEFTDENNDLIQNNNSNNNLNNNSNNNLNNNLNTNSLHNNISNVELKSAENIALERYIINNEPSNQEIINQQYNKYYWNN